METNDFVVREDCDGLTDSRKRAATERAQMELYVILGWNNHSGIDTLAVLEFHVSETS